MSIGQQSGWNVIHDRCSSAFNVFVFGFENGQTTAPKMGVEICHRTGAIGRGLPSTGDPSKMLDVNSASIDVRQRSAKLYGLLAGLVKNRALSKVRAAPPGNGYEALRQQMLSGQPDGSVGMALVLPALTDCRCGSNPDWSLGSFKCDPPKGNGRRPEKNATTGAFYEA